MRLTEPGWNDHYIDLIRDDPSRTLMGSRQENWFYRSLSGDNWSVSRSPPFCCREGC